MQRLEVSGAVRPLYGSLGVKGLKFIFKINAAGGCGLNSFGAFIHCGGTWCRVLVA